MIDATYSSAYTQKFEQKFGSFVLGQLHVYSSLL